MAREKTFGRGKYHPPPPDGGQPAKPVEYVNDDPTPTEHAVRMFERFVRDWTATAIPPKVIEDAVSGVRRAIRRIAPIDDHRAIEGYAVFKIQLNHKYALEYVCVSPVFDKLKWAQNSCQGFHDRDGGDYVVCDIKTNQERRR